MTEPNEPLPRNRFAVPTGHPTPDGYISSGELLEFLLPKWWGALLCDLGSEISGYPVDHESLLGRVATDGQVIECVRVIREAGESGALTAHLPDDPTNPGASTFNRITPADWSATSLSQWEDDLMTGKVSRHSDNSMAWADGRPILFRQNEAEAWLGGLRSPHLLRKPPQADPAALPNRPIVTLSEAASWLAFGEALDCRTLFERRTRGDDRAVRFAEGGDGAESAPEFAIWFATFLASFGRLEQVRHVLRDAMARGELIGRGRCQYLKGKTEVQAIPPEVFQLTVHLIPIIDGIGIDPGAPNSDGDAFLNGGNWTEIRFARHDLERLLGGNQDRTAIENPQATQRADGLGGVGAPRKMDKPVDGFWERFPDGKPHELTWRKIAHLVAKHIGWSKLDGENLRKAVASRKKRK